MFFDIILTVFLVLLNGFFVAAEFSILKVRYSQIQLKAKAGNRFARKSQIIIDKLDTYLSATQLGITLASLGLGWIGEPVVARMISAFLASFDMAVSEPVLHKISLPLAFLLITILHIVIGELVPKSIAIRKAEPTALVISYPLNWFYLFFSPFIWLMNSLSAGLLKLMGIKPASDDDIHSAEELRILVEQSKKGGAIQDENYEIIKNAFDFTDHTAKQIMIPRHLVFSLDIELSTEEMIERIFEYGFSRIPVYESSMDNLVGIAYAKDVLREHYRNPGFRIKDILHPVLYIYETKRISEILKEFQQRHIHLAVIIDEFGGTQGIVTMEDILEELVGEIQDEDDDEKPVVEKREDGSYFVQAIHILEDINPYLPHPFVISENYNTLSGLILYYLNRIPKLNEKIIIENYEICVSRLQHRTIQGVILREVIPEDDQSE
jgi:CBS domain containing-hemolysin-like protein